MAKERLRADALRGRNRDDLVEEVTRLERELFDLKFRGPEGENPDATRACKLKRNIARYYTVLREMELGIDPRNPARGKRSKGS